MSTPILELEGTWEEILEHGPELKGMRVSLRAVPEEVIDTNDTKPLSARQERMLSTYKMLMERKLTDKEKKILDDFPEFRKQHPFSLRQLSDEDLEWIQEEA